MRHEVLNCLEPWLPIGIIAQFRSEMTENIRDNLNNIGLGLVADKSQIIKFNF